MGANEILVINIESLAGNKYLIKVLDNKEGRDSKDGDLYEAEYGYIARAVPNPHPLLLFMHIFQLPDKIQDITYSWTQAF